MTTMDETYADIDDERACQAATPLIQPRYRPEAYTIMPNPARDRFTVTLPTIDAPTHIRVINLLGNVVLELPANGTTSQEIDCAALPNGTYIVSASNQYRWFPIGKVNIYR